ncbi:MAG: DNA-processing protein DprA [Alcaligenaceae bacterium]
MGRPALAAHFPKRNRIVAGLSLGVVVVEAALKSGSLITARLAVDMGREVFAIPGSIHSPLARGPHALIQQGAKLVESGADILTELHPAAGRPQSVSSVAQASFARSSQALRSPTWDAIGYDPITEDQLQRRTGLPPAQLQVELFALELEGHIARRGHGQFVRTRA